MDAIRAPHILMAIFLMEISAPGSDRVELTEAKSYSTAASY
jgi:hypothetical protein